MQIKSNRTLDHGFTCSGQGFFEGYASVFHVIDGQMDVVRPGAFRWVLDKWRQSGRLPKLLWQHDPAQIIGIWHGCYEDDRGLYVKGQLLLEVEKAREAYALMCAKAIEGLSIGYVVRQSRKGTLNGRAVTFLDDLDVKEISLVTFPANAQAIVTAVKTQTPTEVDVQKAVRELCHMLCESGMEGRAFLR